MKICLVLSFVFLTSCFKFGGSKLTENSEGEFNEESAPFPAKGIVDFRSFVDVDVSQNIANEDNLTLKTRSGRILYSGPAYSLRQKSGIEIPYKIDAIIVSVEGDKNQKIVKVSSNALRIGY